MENLISVIIPSYNSVKTIPYTLDGLLNQEGDFCKEIIVVDSSDDPAMKNVINSYIGKIKFINAGVRVMPAKGRNIGGNAAKGEILAFIDSDAYPASDWLKAIARAYSEGCFAGGGCVEAPPFQLGTNIALSQLYLQFNEFLKSGERRKKFFIPSVNLFCNRELFLTLGGFPEIRASEDTLFGLKLTEQNNLWFDPSITVYHIFRTDFKPFLQNQKILGEYIIRYRKSYYNKFYYKSIFPILLLPIFLFIKVNSMLFRIVKAGKKHFFFFLKSSPLFILGMIYWSIGFLIGSFDRK